MESHPITSESHPAAAAKASSSTFKQLKVAVVGGGIGGLAAAVAFRRAGHLGMSLVFSSRCPAKLTLLAS
jgi:threonine dehydrogenase-like Zn-dependent dehydrogenase